MKALYLLFLFPLVACSSMPRLKELPAYTSYECKSEYEAFRESDPIERLNKVSDFYDQACYHEVIGLGESIRSSARDKYYHVLAETAEAVLPEGTATEYVLESYERSYLSFLMSSSYHQLQVQNASFVEIKKSYEEGKAFIYNYGDDPANLSMQASVWENLKEDNSARPLWKRVSELAKDDLTLKNFANARIKEIDAGKKTDNWKIYSYGKFPEIDWKLDLAKTQGGYFNIFPETAFPMTCSSDDSLFISTESWSQQIAQRHHKDRHPLLNVKSWTRLPVGLSLGVATAVAGIGVGVGGCGLAIALASDSSSNNEAAGDLCGMSIYAGAAIAGESGTVANYVLRPDLRNWTAVPEAFLITRASEPLQDQCLPSNIEGKKSRLTLIFQPASEITKQAVP